MKKFKTSLGFDISKHTLDVYMLDGLDDRNPQLHQIPNKEKDIDRFFAKLERSSLNMDDVIVCFENTGAYGMRLCYVLQARQISYSMIPALELKRSMGLVRGKTDKSDAQCIARYAFTHPHKLQLTQLPERDLMELRLLLSERDKLVKAIKLLSSTAEHTSFLAKTETRQVLKINRATIKTLNKQLECIDTAIQTIIQANEVMKQQYQLATSVPGVGPQTAINMIVTTRCFTAFANWRKLACYAGIAPFEYQSGISVRGRTKVSHYADKRLKALLNMAALSAKKYDHELRKYYDRKVAEGKNGMVVMNALRCKIVSRVFATIKRGTPFVNTQKFIA